MSKPNPWHKEFLSCFDSLPIFMLNVCCPIIGASVTQYLAHKEVSELNLHLTLCLSLTCCCIGNSFNRKRLRKQLALDGYLVCDCLLYMCCCYSCMAVQEYQEVNWQILNKLIPKELN